MLKKLSSDFAVCFILFVLKYLGGVGVFTEASIKHGVSQEN